MRRNARPRQEGDDARMYGMIALIVGPLFIVAGWLTLGSLGYMMIVTGLAFLLAAPILRQSWHAAGAAIALIALGWTWPALLDL